MAEIDDFAEFITKELENYSEEVDEKLQMRIDEKTKEVYLDLRNNPNIPKRTGQYAKGFYKKTLAKGRGYKRNVIGNRLYQLTHLLEYGHMTKNGTRTKAFPHWQKAQESVDRLPQELKEVIEH